MTLIEKIEWLIANKEILNDQEARVMDYHQKYSMSLSGRAGMGIGQVIEIDIMFDKYFQPKFLGF
jgi:hypothetical protein